MKTASFIITIITWAFAQQDSTAIDTVTQDSIASVSTVLDTSILQRKADSLISIVEDDSINLRHIDLVIFKGQSILKEKKLSINTRIECLKFFLTNELTTPQKAVEYLNVVKKYCQDKQDFFYSMRYLASDNDKTLCMAYYKKSKDELAKVQTEIYRLSSNDVTMK
jgi:hypothetical protein